MLIRDSTREESKILKEQVIVTKYKPGITGSREYEKHHYMANTALYVKSSVAKHFVPTSHEGKVESGNNHYKITQEMLCGNTDKIKEFKERCDKYDMT